MITYQVGNNNSVLWCNPISKIAPVAHKLAFDQTYPNGCTFYAPELLLFQTGGVIGVTQMVPCAICNSINYNVNPPDSVPNSWQVMVMQAVRIDSQYSNISIDGPSMYVQSPYMSYGSLSVVKLA